MSNTLDSTLEQRTKQYHPAKQRKLLEQSEIYQQSVPNTKIMTTDAVIEYDQLRCTKKK